MTTMTETRTAISLEVDCPHAICQRFADPLYEKLADGNYDTDRL